MGHGSTATFDPGGVVNNTLSLSGGSTLTLVQAKGELTGLTFNGTSAGSLAIDGTSNLVLSLGDNDRPSWIFRWKDPSDGTWEATLNGLIGAGKIDVTAPRGYSVYDLGGYTYLGSTVPAPGTILGLAQLSLIAGAVVLWRRRRSSLAK